MRRPGEPVRQAGGMNSRNRLIGLVAVVLLGIAAAVAALLNGGKDPDGASGAAKPASAPASVTPSTAAASAAASATRSGATGGPKPSAPAKSPTAQAGWVPTDAALADVCRGRLPAQALDTLGLIARGGPYPYRSDGIVFENRENRLPRQGSGYYHEFTVVTPGSDDRGTRRIVTGGAGEQYWTADHYASFQEIDPRC
ncbi:putative guanyl-specific ribonuclease [Kitasatospora setae KM-6054]|uniref:Putative guanyl-specific ribonuclease n=2 Tax=Streptomycetaceae TaxID=2062 RepID=E4NAW1_KITSK|nr:putative guanyl-specific ribonuclease [Kitasatospora setae KM-6054]